MPNYTPPTHPGTRALLGKIVTVLLHSVEIDHSAFRKENVKIIIRLPTGQLYIDCGLNVDDDGDTTGFPEGWVVGVQPSPGCPPPCKSSHQDSTSYTMTSGAALNANSIPYVVLPMRCRKRPNRKAFWEEAGVKIGDGVVAVWNGRLVHALFGDEGPCDQLGEASLETIRSLDPNWNLFETSNTQPPVITTRNEAHPSSDVVLIVFPGTRQGATLSNLAAFQSNLKARLEALCEGVNR
jgi:hypothetical protein